MSEFENLSIKELLDDIRLSLNDICVKWKNDRIRSICDELESRNKQYWRYPNSDTYT